MITLNEQLKTIIECLISLHNAILMGSSSENIKTRKKIEMELRKVRKLMVDTFEVTEGEKDWKDGQ